MTNLSNSDIRAAKLDPRAIFSEPKQVVASQSLSATQKLDILEQWRQDEIALQRADGEGMSEGEDSMLRLVDAALHELHEQTGVKTSLDG